jgi:hypothetical protein
VENECRGYETRVIANRERGEEASRDAKGWRIYVSEARVARKGQGRECETPSPLRLLKGTAIRSECPKASVLVFGQAIARSIDGVSFILGSNVPKNFPQQFQNRGKAMTGAGFCRKRRFNWPVVHLISLLVVPIPPTAFNFVFALVTTPLMHDFAS